MSLIDEYMEMTGGCVMLDKQTVSDAAITLDSSIQAKIAEQQGVTGLYTVTTSKALNLQYHDVFKRKSDNKIFRVTSDGDDKHTPNSSALDMRQVSAEEYTLPINNT